MSAHQTGRFPSHVFAGAKNWSWWICTLILFIAVPKSVFSDSKTFPEYQVKALYLVNFGYYTKWPQSSKKDQKIELCVLGYYPFKQYFSKQSIEKYPIKKQFHVQKLTIGESTEGCQMVFISDHEGANVAEILNTLKTKPILTIGESKNFIQLGGIIFLSIEEGSVVFEINLDAQRKAGLKMSSRFLNLAKKIHGVKHSSRNQAILL